MFLESLQTLRQRLYPVLHREGRRLLPSFFAIADVDGEQYAGTFKQADEASVETVLARLGFTWNPIAALKYHYGSGDVSDGSWALRSWPLARNQLHISLYDSEEGEVDVYAHYERNWLTHPIQHYQRVGLDPAQGVRRFRRLLEANRDMVNRNGVQFAVLDDHRTDSDDSL